MPRHYYSCVLEPAPGKLLQTDLDTFSIVKAIDVSYFRAHVIAVDDNYAYIGTLGNQNDYTSVRVIRVKIPEMTIPPGDKDIIFPETDGAIYYITYANGKIYAAPNKVNYFVEIDPATFTRTRNIPVNPGNGANGLIYCDPYLYFQTVAGGKAYLVKMEANTYVEVSRVELDTSGLKKANGDPIVGTRDCVEADGFIFCLLAGDPCRVIKVNPTTMTVVTQIDCQPAKFGDRIVFYNGLLYFNSDKAPGAFVKLNPDTLVYDVLDVPEAGGQGNFDCDAATGYLYGNFHYNRKIIRVNETTFKYDSQIDVSDYGRITQSVIYDDGLSNGMSYKPSDLVLPITAARVTEITSSLSEVAGDEGQVVTVDAKLIEGSGPNQGAGIPNKTIKYFIESVEVGTGTTDANGDVSFDYTLKFEDNGKSLTISYDGN